MSKTHVRAGQSEQYKKSVYFEGSLDEVKETVKAFKQASRINLLDGGESPLHYACMGGNVDVARFLITEAKANLISSDKLGRHPIHCAVESGHAQIVSALVEGLDVKKWTSKVLQMGDDRGSTPLHLAAKHPAIFKELLPLAGLMTSPCFLYNEGKQKPGVLHCAVAAGQHALVELILQAVEGEAGGVKSQLSQRDSQGHSALAIACMEGQTLIAKTLATAATTKAGAPDETGVHMLLELQSNDGSTAAHWAFCMGHVKLGDWLVENGARNDTADADGRTPKEAREQTIENGTEEEEGVGWSEEGEGAGQDAAGSGDPNDEGGASSGAADFSAEEANKKLLEMENRISSPKGRGGGAALDMGALAALVRQSGREIGGQGDGNPTDYSSGGVGGGKSWVGVDAEDDKLTPADAVERDAWQLGARLVDVPGSPSRKKKEAAAAAKIAAAKATSAVAGGEAVGADEKGGSSKGGSSEQAGVGTDGGVAGDGDCEGKILIARPRGGEDEGEEEDEGLKQARQLQKEEMALLGIDYIEEEKEERRRLRMEKKREKKEGAGGASGESGDDDTEDADSGEEER
jgi:ankyrin repeat protein